MKRWRARRWKREKARNTWKGMIARCHDPLHGKGYHSLPSYADYGARGIRVCERWRGASGFEQFIADMGLPRTRAHTLDRIDPSGDYEPGNVRWTLPLMQMMNRSNTRWVEAEHPDTGETERWSIGQWSRSLGIPRSTISARLRRGWSDAEAVSGPDADVPF